MSIRHRILADASTVRTRISSLAASLSSRRPAGCDLVVVLNGSVLFASDLFRALTVPARVDFVSVSAYRPDAGRVRLLKDLDLDVTGRHVVLVHDVVHTGLTTAYLVGELERRGAATVEVCTMVDRAGRRIVPVTIHLAGFEVTDEFVIGMGLDYRGRYRNLDSLLVVDEADLERDPDALTGDLYGA